MKKLGLLAVIALSLSAFKGNPAAKKAAVDTQNSKLEWVAEKVTGKHWGTVNIKEGSFELTDGQVSGGTFTIDMTSIKVTDIEDKETNGKLVGHLKSPDFFSVAENPTSKFVIKKVKEKAGDNGNNYEVTGDLTIKGITKRIILSSLC